MRHAPLRAVLGLTLVLGLWQALVWGAGLPRYILPAPTGVAQALLDHAALIGGQARFTLLNLLAGLAAGLVLGGMSALHLALSPVARRLLRPILIGAQAVPIFALAPILTLWLGFGAASKIVIVALVIYFPIASAFFDGLMRLPAPLADLAHLMQAHPLRRLLLLQLPHALPALISGLRLAIVQAPFAVILGEWVGSSQGLGHLILLANGRGQTELMFAALMVLAAISLTLFLILEGLVKGRG